MSELADAIRCAEAVAQLADYLKDELTPLSAEQVRRHLEACRPCFDHAQLERNFLLMLERKAQAQCCPEEIRARVLAVLRRADLTAGGDA
jgi:anti-sigma factor (TIGR02949 family)